MLDKEFSVEANEMTPTLKLKRKEIIKRYKEPIDSMKMLFKSIFPINKPIIFTLAVVFVSMMASSTVGARLRRVNKLLIIYSNGKQGIAYTLDRPNTYITSHGGTAVIKQARPLKSWLIEDRGSLYGKNLKATEPNAKAHSTSETLVRTPSSANQSKSRPKSALVAPRHKNSLPKSSISTSGSQLTKDANQQKDTSIPVTGKTPGVEATPRGCPAGLSPTILKRIARYEKFINRYAKKYKLEPDLLKAVIYVESSGNPYAISYKGAKGLMQLMDDTARDMNVQNVFNPIQNLEGGAKYLRQQLDAFQNNLPLALAAYNSGPNYVKRKVFFQKTRGYVKRVITVKKALSSNDATGEW